MNWIARSEWVSSIFMFSLFSDWILGLWFLLADFNSGRNRRFPHHGGHVQQLDTLHLGLGILRTTLDQIDQFLFVGLMRFDQMLLLNAFNWCVLRFDTFLYLKICMDWMISWFRRLALHVWFGNAPLSDSHKGSKKKTGRSRPGALEISAPI